MAGRAGGGLSAVELLYGSRCLPEMQAAKQWHAALASKSYSWHTRQDCCHRPSRGCVWVGSHGSWSPNRGGGQVAIEGRRHQLQQQVAAWPAHTGGQPLNKQLHSEFRVGERSG